MDALLNNIIKDDGDLGSDESIDLSEEEENEERRVKFRSTI